MVNNVACFKLCHSLLKSGLVVDDMPFKVLFQEKYDLAIWTVKKKLDVQKLIVINIEKVSLGILSIEPIEWKSLIGIFNSNSNVQILSSGIENVDFVGDQKFIDTEYSIVQLKNFIDELEKTLQKIIENHPDISFWHGDVFKLHNVFKSDSKLNVREFTPEKEEFLASFTSLENYKLTIYNAMNKPNPIEIFAHPATELKGDKIILSAVTSTLYLKKGSQIDIHPEPINSEQIQLSILEKDNYIKVGNECHYPYEIKFEYIIPENSLNITLN